MFSLSLEICFQEFIRGIRWGLEWPLWLRKSFSSSKMLTPFVAQIMPLLRNLAFPGSNSTTSCYPIPIWPHHTGLLLPVLAPAGSSLKSAASLSKEGGEAFCYFIYIMNRLFPDHFLPLFFIKTGIKHNSAQGGHVLAGTKYKVLPKQHPYSLSYTGFPNFWGTFFWPHPGVLRIFYSWQVTETRYVMLGNRAQVGYMQSKKPHLLYSCYSPSFPDFSECMIQNVGSAQT